MNKTLLVSLLVLIPFIILGMLLFSDYNKKSQEVTENNYLNLNNENMKKNQSTPTPTASENFDKNKKYKAILKTTEGDITIELFTDKTPITAGNFIKLSKSNFYNNTIFHRVINNFMIQGGDPTGTGSGGPGYKFDDEKFDGEYSRGTIAMANAGPNTNGSQFFIMHADYPLPKNYVIFGKTISGIETVDKIATAPTTANMMGENSTPVSPVKILSVDIVEE